MTKTRNVCRPFVFGDDCFIKRVAYLRCIKKLMYQKTKDRNVKACDDFRVVLKLDKNDKWALEFKTDCPHADKTNKNAHQP